MMNKRLTAACSSVCTQLVGSRTPFGGSKYRKISLEKAPTLLMGGASTRPHEAADLVQAVHEALRHIHQLSRTIGRVVSVPVAFHHRTNAVTEGISDVVFQTLKSRGHREGKGGQRWLDPPPWQRHLQRWAGQPQRNSVTWICYHVTQHVITVMR